MIGFKGAFGKLPIEEIDNAVKMNKEYSQAEMMASDEAMKVVFNSLSEFLHNYDANKVVPSLEIPVFFIQGKDDFNTPTVLAKTFYNSLSATKGKTWIELEGCAHFPFYENRLEFLKVLRQALGNR